MCAMMQTHLKVLGHLAHNNALHLVEELSLGHGACFSHHLLSAVIH